MENTPTAPAPPPAAAPAGRALAGLAMLLVAALTLIVWWPLRSADIQPSDRAVLAAAAADAAHRPHAERAGWLRDTRGPLTRALLAAEVRAWPNDPPALRAVALALHAASALLLVLVAVQLAAVFPPATPLPAAGLAAVAALAALLYALHPQRAAALASLLGHGVPLATAAALLAANLQVASWSARRPWALRCGAAALMLVSLLAGAAAVAVPLALVGLDALRRRSLTGALRGAGLLLLVTFGGLGLGLALLHGPAEALERPDDLRDTAPALTLLARLAVGTRGLAQHALAALWPPLLPFDSDAVQPVALPTLTYGGPLLGLLGAGGLIVTLARRLPGAAVALATVLLVAAPPLLLWRPGRTAASPTDGALPAAVAAAALAMLIARIAPPAALWRHLAWWGAGATLLAAALAAAAGARHEIALRADGLKWWAAVEHGARGPSRPGGAWLYYSYARALEEAGEIERAAQLYRAALAVRPTLLQAHTDLCRVYFAAGEFREVYNISAGALTRWPSEPEVRHLLGAALAALGDLSAAETHLRWAAEHAPGEPRYAAALAALARLRAGAAPADPPGS